jgi:methylated-DNA-[protein]-cysteine S-methyltransferase
LGREAANSKNGERQRPAQSKNPTASSLKTIPALVRAAHFPTRSVRPHQKKPDRLTADNNSAQLVRAVGIEPTHLAVPDFESGASTSSTTPASKEPEYSHPLRRVKCAKSGLLGPLFGASAALDYRFSRSMLRGAFVWVRTHYFYCRTLMENIMSATTQNAYIYKTVQTPVGELTLVGSDRGLAAILWENDKPGRVRLNIVARDDNHPVLLETQRQLGEYFAGQRRHFTVKLDFAGTDFQKQVWQALLAIPFGQTRSYGEIAVQLGNPKAMRAVGAANGKNPISIIAPCHRVIGATGKLTGFAGGLETKAYLLQLENRKSAAQAA